MPSAREPGLYAEIQAIVPAEHIRQNSLARPSWSR